MWQCSEVILPPEVTLDPRGTAAAAVALPQGGAGQLFGIRDENLRKIEEAFAVRLTARGEEVRIQGEAPNVATVKHLVEELALLVERGFRPSPKDVETAIRVIAASPGASLVDFFLGEAGAAKATPKLVTPRSINQKQYLEAMREQDLVFAIGPAGTGKTYLAVAVAATFLLEKRVRRLVLTRPAVEAGEKLGFLPGDLVEKVNPYLRPLYDALYDIIGFDRVGRMIERSIIEIAPLAFMRGRTLNDSFIILDEAQNTTPEQMKMFVTRIGFGSKAVVTGDITQVDLPAGRASGLVHARGVMSGVEGIAFTNFTEKDVVRHPLVQRIVSAYDRFERAGGDDGATGRAAVAADKSEVR
ncbi:MAG TPA: PhoH family protein [Thermoanaerobaculia bacterium]|nr:PhoH family protein [Thermoanaerobaculia bacterium]